MFVASLCVAFFLQFSAIDLSFASFFLRWNFWHFRLTARLGSLLLPNSVSWLRYWSTAGSSQKVSEVTEVIGNMQNGLNGSQNSPSSKISISLVFKVGRCQF